MDKLGGSLHCLSCPIPFFAELPKGLMSFEQANALATKQFTLAPANSQCDLAPLRARKKSDFCQRLSSHPACNFVLSGKIESCQNLKVGENSTSQSVRIRKLVCETGQTGLITALHKVSISPCRILLHR